MAMGGTAASTGARDIAPPRMSTGAAGWMRDNLFDSAYHTALTIVSGIALVAAVWFSLAWVFGSADWKVIAELGGRFAIGQYNTETACPGQDCFWRPQAGLLFATTFLGMAWGLIGGATSRRIALMVASISAAFAFLPYSLETMGMDVRLLMLANLPAVMVGWAVTRYTRWRTPRRLAVTGLAFGLITIVLLSDPLLPVRAPLGLFGAEAPAPSWAQPVSVLYWGGLMLNLLLAAAGILFSFPLGILLALGRRSTLPVVKLLCVLFIEVFRGMPLITLLFMSQVLVPLAFPEDFPLNTVSRAAIVITLFSAAYMAENIRGGLQGLHPGQAQAARALGLAAWQTTLYISLPQAIRNVIPAIVGQFIALFKDTSLVYIIAMLDIVQMGRSFIQGNPEYLTSARELFVFIGLVFWAFTYTMSRVSQRLEELLGVGRR